MRVDFSYSHSFSGGRRVALISMCNYLVTSNVGLNLVSLSLHINSMHQAEWTFEIFRIC